MDVLFHKVATLDEITPFKHKFVMNHLSLHCVSCLSAQAAPTNVCLYETCDIILGITIFIHAALYLL